MRRAFLMSLFGVLSGCAQVALAPLTSVCTDYDFDDDDSATFVVRADTDADGAPDSDVLTAGSDIHVSRVGMFMGCEDVFVPELAGGGRNVEVREFWEENTDGDCSLCFAPTVVLSSAPAGKFSIGWFDGYADEPVGTLEFRVE